jgi:8-oxo-dGTP diphosphatase
MEVKIIPVVCAIIEQDGLVLCALRSEHMSLPGKWEFPGGKLEVNELPEEALIREIKEELNIEIRIVEALPIAEHAYVPEKIIHLIPFRCAIVGNEKPIATEHSELRWVKRDVLPLLDWAAADVPIVLNYIQTK